MVREERFERELESTEPKKKQKTNNSIATPIYFNLLKETKDNEYGTNNTVLLSRMATARQRASAAGSAQFKIVYRKKHCVLQGKSVFWARLSLLYLIMDNDCGTFAALLGDNVSRTL